MKTNSIETNKKLENKFFYDPIVEPHKCWGLESITCDLPVECMFNSHRQESATYIDLKARRVVVFNDDEEPNMFCIRIPDLEYMAPHKEALYDFLGYVEFPTGNNSSRYLKENGLYYDFCEHRIQMAKEALDYRLAAFGLKLVDESKIMK